MPRKAKQQEEPAPTELDRLDPGPDTPQPDPPPKPRRQARVKGPVERAVLKDLARFPDDLRTGGIAAVALRLAAEVDAGVVLGRDAAGHGREIRMCITQLREFAPGEVKGDHTDEVRAKRERRLAQGG